MRFLTFLMTTILIGIISFAQAAPEDIVYDPLTGDYVINYQIKGTAYQTTFIPANKIDPSVKSEFKSGGSGRLVYRYTIKNGKKSKQNLDVFFLVASNVTNNSLMTPRHWDGNMLPNSHGDGFRVGWSYKSSDDTAGILPGEKESGFSIETADLPGISVMRFSGATPIVRFEGYGPSEEIEAQLNKLEAEEVNTVPRPAAAPLIPVPNPFDTAAVLTNMQKHINQDLVTMKLIDSTFASQLDRLFQTAIAAAKGGNTAALKGDIKDLRRMLKREHADVDKDDEGWDKDDDGKDKEKDKSRLIDKLAAKVLDFDLKYIQKRLGHDD